MRGGAIVLGLLVAASSDLSAQPARQASQPGAETAAVPDAVGDWSNASQIDSGAMPVAIHIRREAGLLAGTLDVPDQGAADVPLADVKAGGANLSFGLPAASARYAGVWDSARQAYVGVFSTPGQQGPLVFTRGRLPPPKPLDWSAPMAPGFTYVPGPAARARVGPTLPIGKCINVSDSLEAPIEGAWGAVIHDDDLAIIKAAGFQTVRIPVRWSAHAMEAAPYTIDPNFLARVHHVVDLATRSGLNIILNVHDYDGLDAAPEANAGRFAALWRQIAASFAAAPATIWFELDNEPHDKLTNANLMSVFAPALSAIRATNPDRPVLIGGQGWSGIDSLATLPMPDDANVVPTFHYYDPFAFTHQGATWVGPHPPPMGRPYGSPADKALLEGDVQKVRSYMARTGRVPVLGEFGAQDDPRVPLEQRIRYYKTISAAFASIGVQSCAWGYRVGFRLRQGDHWLPGLVEAISTTTTSRRK